ncbi:MAG: hypothetical protein ACI8Z1_002626, partial [Candidatus Azotimanducaceae bacterium]
MLSGDSIVSRSGILRELSYYSSTITEGGFLTPPLAPSTV